MSNLTPFNRGTGGGLSRLPRATGKALDHVHGQGMVSAAKVQAGAYVAHVAMQEVGALSMEEELIARRVPHAEGRLQAVVDSFTAGAASEVTSLWYRL